MWRPNNRQQSGTNDVQLGGKRRWGGDEPSAPPPPSNGGGAGAGYYDSRGGDRRDDYRRDDRRDERRDDYRRDDRGPDRHEDRGRERRWDDDRGAGGAGYNRDAPRDAPPPPPPEDGPRKRKSRWGDESAKQEVPGLPAVISGNVSQTQLDNYAVHVRLEEINRKLRTGDVVPPPTQRSPSPPPQYDAYGRRTNTTADRYRKKLEDERMRLVDRAMKSDPNFRPPSDMSRGKNGRPQDKVYIPVKEFPEINFFGLLVGPRGNSLKRMERESGAKISIRGKGSVKEGKGRQEAWAGDEDDELHCLVMADDEAKVRACVAMINRVIETAASTPEGQNDHKRNQLRELASLNGTLRDDENQLCQNCGEKGHRRWECPQARVYSANVICRLCGGAGHMARDCRGRGDPNLANNKQTQFDSEYSALMAELGEGAGAAAGAAPGQPPQEQRVPPWRIPENWQQNPNMNRGPPGGGFGGPGGPPQQGYGYGGPGGGGGGYGGPQDSGYPGQGGPGGPPGGADPYASYYAGLGQA